MAETIINEMGIYIPLFLDLDLLKIVPSAAIKSIYIPLFLDLDLEKIKWLIMYRKIYIPLFLDLDIHCFSKLMNTHIYLHSTIFRFRRVSSTSCRWIY